MRSTGERRRATASKEIPHGLGWVSGAAAAPAVLSARSSAGGADATRAGEAVDGGCWWHPRSGVLLAATTETTTANTLQARELEGLPSAV